MNKFCPTNPLFSIHNEPLRMRCASGDGSAGAVAMVITDRPLATGTRCSLPLRVVIVLKIVVGHERPRNEFRRIGVELALVLQGKIKWQLLNNIYLSHVID